MSITEQGSWDVPGLPEPPRDDWGDGPAAYEPGERPSRPGDRTPPQDNAAEQSVLGVDAALQGRHRRRQRGAPRRRLLPAGPRDHLRRDHRPLRPRRAGRPDHGRQRAPAARRARRGSAAPPTSTRCRPTSRSPPTPATTPRSSARRRSCAGSSTPAPASCRWATPARARSTTWSTGAGRGLPGHRPAHRARTTRRCRDIMDGVLDEIEAIGNREAGLYGVPDRLRRPRRPDQRSAHRPDDHRRGASRPWVSRRSPSTCAARRRSTTT